MYANACKDGGCVNDGVCVLMHVGMKVLLLMSACVLGSILLTRTYAYFAWAHGVEASHMLTLALTTFAIFFSVDA